VSGAQGQGQLPALKAKLRGLAPRMAAQPSPVQPSPNQGSSSSSSGGIERHHPATQPTSVRLSMGGRPLFSARDRGTMSRASAKARIAYCSTPGTWSAAFSTAKLQAGGQAGRQGAVAHVLVSTGC
jgi:hypothetical protein